MMKLNLESFILFSVIFLIAWLPNTQAQDAHVGPTSILTGDFSNHLLSESIGQAVCFNSTFSKGRLSAGIQRPIGFITTNTDTLGCSGGILSVTANPPGGNWGIGSSIGSSIDSAGIIMFGSSEADSVLTDTVSYIFNGYASSEVFSVSPELVISYGDTTATCSGITLDTLNINVAGGVWSIISDIGASISQQGIVVLGENNGMIANSDTVYYQKSACIDTFVIMTKPIPAIIATDTVSCSGNILDTMYSTFSGGTWSINSSIGATISQQGVVTLGVNPSADDNIDTVLYSISGCSDIIKIKTKTIPSVTATDTADCSGVILTALIPNYSGGSWSMESTIGSTISQQGVVTLGINSTTLIDKDTVIYLLEGCADTLITSIYPTPNITATDTASCAGGQLTAFSVDLSSGMWSIITDIGSSIDQQGVVTLGNPQTGQTNKDSVLYTANGCKDTILVTVFPSVSISAADTTTCSGDTLAQLTANLSGGTWNLLSSVNSVVDSFGNLVAGQNTGSVNVFDTVTYTLTSCIDTVLVVVYPIPDANITNTGSACVEGSLSLDEDGGMAVSWSWNGPGNFNSTQQQPTITNPQSGDYIVSITTGDGCSSKDTLNICVGGVTANCMAQVLISDQTGKVILDSAAIGMGSQSTCSGIAGLSLSSSELQCADGFEQTITLVATDSSGCADSCTATITIQDSINPVEACVASEELVLVWKGLELIPASLVGSSTDNCGADFLEFSFSEDFSNSSFEVSCRDYLRIIDTLTVYIRDASNNVSSCDVAMSFNGPGTEDCGCDWGNLKLKGRITSDDYKAKDFIIGTGYVVDGDSVYMKAGNIITLNPGFRVDAGGSFFARIDSCGDYKGQLSFSETYVDTAVLKHHENKNREDEKALDSRKVESITIMANPNPFQQTMQLSFELPEAGLVNLQLQQIMGERTYRLLDSQFFEAGWHQLTVDGTRLPAGLYVLTLEKEGYYVSQKVTKIQ